MEIFKLKKAATINTQCYNFFQRFKFVAHTIFTQSLPVVAVSG